MPPGDDFDIDVTHVNGRVAVVVVGEIDLDTAPMLHTTLDSIEATSHITVDCAGVDFMDSTGLAVVLRHSTRTSEAGGSVVIRRPSPSVLRLLEWCCLEHLLDPETAGPIG
jgi:anti-anti-sigma factor